MFQWHDFINNITFLVHWRKLFFFYVYGAGTYALLYNSLYLSWSQWKQVSLLDRNWSLHSAIKKWLLFKHCHLIVTMQSAFRVDAVCYHFPLLYFDYMCSVSSTDCVQKANIFPVEWWKRIFTSGLANETSYFLFHKSCKMHWSAEYISN